MPGEPLAERSLKRGLYLRTYPQVGGSHEQKRAEAMVIGRHSLHAENRFS